MNIDKSINESKLLFVISHYTENVVDILSNMKCIEEDSEIIDIYNELYDSSTYSESSVIRPFSFYSDITHKLLSMHKFNNNSKKVIMAIMAILKTDK